MQARKEWISEIFVSRLYFNSILHQSADISNENAKVWPRTYDSNNDLCCNTTAIETTYLNPYAPIDFLIMSLFQITNCQSAFL
jgi:hypothetical protein